MKRVVFGVSCQHIPTTLENLYSIRLHVPIHLLLFGVELLVFHIESAIVVHQIDDVDKTVLTSWNVLQPDSVLKAFALADDVVQIESLN